MAKQRLSARWQRRHLGLSGETSQRPLQKEWFLFITILTNKKIYVILLGTHNTNFRQFLIFRWKLLDIINLLCYNMIAVDQSVPSPYVTGERLGNSAATEKNLWLKMGRLLKDHSWRSGFYLLQSWEIKNIYYIARYSQHELSPIPYVSAENYLTL